MKLKFIHIIIVSIATFILSSCYQEQHFDMPGPYGDKVIIPDTMPFPFDTTRLNGEWIIKDGVPDYSKIVFHGYTDFRPQHGDTVIWETKNGGFTSQQCNNFYPLSTTDHFLRDQYSYQYTFFHTKSFVKFAPGSKWYFYTRMSMPYSASTSPYFLYGCDNGWGHRNTAGFDGGSARGPVLYAQVDGKLLKNEGWPLFSELVTPGEPFDFELICVDYFVYMKINGKVVWFYNLPADEFSFPMTYCPWRNSVTFYDMYMEGDIENIYDFVAHEEENNYRTIQAPALTKTSSGDVLLFAEGRTLNYELTSNADYAKLRSNATDIVMKRSSDGGETWSELTAIVGDRSSVNISPIAITDKDDKHYLLYTKDNSGHLDGNTFEIYQSTSDNGTSWSSPQKVNSTLQGEYAQRTISGHGIELKKANLGRLVAMTSCVKGDTNTLAAIYSDDKGMTWQSGNVVDAKDITSGNVVELSDGRLMLIMSHNGTNTKCQLAYSSDGGETWSAPVYSTLSTGTKGSRYPGSTIATEDGKIVHFTPSSERTRINDNLARYRDNPAYGDGFGVTVSSNDGADWSAFESLLTKTTYRGNFFLCKSMDAVTLNDGRVLCITEGGVKCPKEGLVRFYK